MKISMILNFIKTRLLQSKLLVFFIFSVVWTLIPEKLPEKIYNYKIWLYKERKWEHGGLIYEKVFLVKKWKSKLPDIGDVFKWRFSKKHMCNINSNYIHRFLVESCKAEFTHWMIILSTILFVFWSGLVGFLEIFTLATVLNLPYIIIQRYNRPRLVRLLRKNPDARLELATVKA